MRLKTAALLFLGCLLITACSSKKKDEIFEEKSVSELYTQAFQHLSNEEYKKAVKGFAEVERQHPYSKWANKAQIMGAYTSYLSGKFDDAIVSLDHYIQLHPGSKDAPYAYYLKAICYYAQIENVKNDQQITEMAMEALNEVVAKFPNTQYAKDAKLKIDLTRDHLAGKQMAVGRYYLSQKKYISALNRFKVVVDDYQITTHLPEALYRMVEVYLELGIKDEAKKTAAILGHNYVNSDWYKKAYELIKNAGISLN